MPEKFENDKAQVEGFRIDEAGTGPWMVEKADGKLTVKNGTVTRAVVLDANGMSRGKGTVKREGGALEVTLPADALYVVLE